MVHSVVVNTVVVGSIQTRGNDLVYFVKPFRLAFFSFTLYYAYSKVGRRNVVIEYSVLIKKLLFPIFISINIDRISKLY